MMASHAVPTRSLGKNGPLVLRMGLGLMPLSGTYSLPGTDDERMAFLDAAYEKGGRFWDTGTHTDAHFSDWISVGRTFNC
jgi:aryl-alcohol dehydrogenase-like predicted oxidoreductase